MILRINSIDIVPYIAFGGVSWKREDAHAPGSGRTALDAKMWISRVGSKKRLDITCRPLYLSEASLILKLIKPVWVDVVFTDPEEGEPIHRTMYSNNIPASFVMAGKNGKEDLWGGIAFPLIEQ